MAIARGSRVHRWGVHAKHCEFDQKTFKTVCPAAATVRRILRSAKRPSRGRKPSCLGALQRRTRHGIGLDRIAKETFIGLEGDAYFGESMLRTSKRANHSDDE